MDAFTALLTDEGRSLLDLLADHAEADELALATRLRREHPPELVAAALTQSRLRQRGRAKFGPDADRMYFTPNGLEQSTRASVADHRAARLVAAGSIARAVDLCCGIGGDALALARAGIAVHAVDLDPLTCAVARANAAALGLAELITVECADVTGVDLHGYDAALIDPARRTARGRTFDPESYSPPFSFLGTLAERVACGAAKVAPGIPHEIVPAGMEAEWVSDRGDVKEAVLWWGRLRGAELRATLLPGGACLTAGFVRQAPVGPVRRYLYEPDGAVIRAHLVAEVGELVEGNLVDETIAYLSSDRLVGTAFASAYEITDVLPFNLKRLKALLRERGVGNLTVKKRGSAVEPEEIRRRVKPSGPNAATVLLTRVAGAPTMLIAQPVPNPA
ncbi:THUMP-like domain-containing protein [Embleya sp. NBC_00896]|uniref:class I SAM-dependent methyltransferase n=1 Tax=Embleya sp. NBC_00896 TaxID=2975961 RepID=UPI00386D3C70|nr:class I SAM-dependent methyltransferase [Embleya sp. NBC_00896]